MNIKEVKRRINQLASRRKKKDYFMEIDRAG